MYLIFVAIDWIVMILVNTIDSGDETVCYHNVYVIAEGELGSLFMGLYDIFFYSQSILIWNIFYRIPKSYGFLLLKRENSVHISPLLDEKPTLLKDTQV